jgi:hypothetical protein
MSILFQMSGFPRFTHVGSPPISADRGVDKQGDPFKSRPPLLPFFLFYICCLFFSFFRPQRKKKGRCERHPVSSSITLSFFVVASSVQFAVRRLIIIFADDLQSPPFAPLQILHNQLQKKKTRPFTSTLLLCCRPSQTSTAFVASCLPRRTRHFPNIHDCPFQDLPFRYSHYQVHSIVK